MTTETTNDVRAFIDAVPSARRRADAETLLELYGRVTGATPVMWSGRAGSGMAQSVPAVRAGYRARRPR